MARKYSRSASKDVASALRKRKRGGAFFWVRVLVPQCQGEPGHG
jgi:hypothetical protein